jgi:hypothetical protein
MSVLKHLNLCSEEYYLTLHRYRSESLWQIWGLFLRGFFGALQGECPLYGPNFLSTKDFVEYVEPVQAERGPSSNVVQA